MFEPFDTRIRTEYYRFRQYRSYIVVRNRIYTRS